MPGSQINMEEINGRSLLLINREWQRLQAVIDTRVAEAWEYRNQHGKEEAPGMCTGLLVKRVKATKRTVTMTYTLDVKTLREARALERHAMKECAAAEAQDTTTQQGNVLPVVTDRPVVLEIRRSHVPKAHVPAILKKAA